MTPVLEMLEARTLSSIVPLLASGIALGALHSFAPDHLAAVGVFVSRRPHWRPALTIGARWGVGHSLVILLVGGALVIMGWRLPQSFAPSLERIVGVTLIGLGLAALVRALRIHGHRHEHGGVAHWHLHSHRRSEQHDHAHHAALGMGMLHGLAGTGALVIAIPLAATQSAAVALAYLIAFSLGTTASMAVVGAMAGWAVRRAADRSIALMRTAACATATASVLVGAWWVIVA